MRILITGSRTWDDADYIRRVLDGLFNDNPFGFHPRSLRWCHALREPGRQGGNPGHPAQVGGPVSDPIVDALRAERKSRGWSQTDVGRKMGHTTYGSVWQWENEAVEPKLSSLRAWAKALGFDVVLVPSGEREDR